MHRFIDDTLAKIRYYVEFTGQIPRRYEKLSLSSLFLIISRMDIFGLGSNIHRLRGGSLRNIRLLLLPMIVFAAGCANFQRSQTAPERSVKDFSYQSERNDEGSQMRKRVMVLPFLTGDNVAVNSRQIVDNARITLIEELNKSGLLIAFTEDELRSQALKARAASGYDIQVLAKPAQDLGITAIMEGKLIDLKLRQKTPQVGIVRNVEREYDAIVELKIVNVRNQKSIFNTRKTVTFSDSDTRIGSMASEDQKASLDPHFLSLLVQEAFLEFVPQILQAFERVSWEGRIAAVQGDRYFLNVGKVSGVQIGDILKVLDEASDVYDPESGSHIGRVSGKMKGTIEVVSYFGIDGAIAILHSGVGFKENDRVETYQ